MYAQVWARRRVRALMWKREKGSTEPLQLLTMLQPMAFER